MTIWNNQSPLLLAAFAGWNDAGEAATAAVNKIIEDYSLVPVYQFETEEYIDYQYYRPVQRRDESGTLSIEWPTLQLFGPGEETDKQIYVLVGPEPSRYWTVFVDEVIELAQDFGIARMLFLGSMLADMPHTRPVSTISTTNNVALAHELGIEKSKYEGPIGIASAIDHAVSQEGISLMSIWAQVPHYVHNPPAPKAVLALLRSAEKYLKTKFNLSALEVEAQAWQEGVDIATRGDEDLAAYIEQLEKQRDAADIPEVSGDAIAKEFEEFLKNPGNEQ